MIELTFKLNDKHPWIDHPIPLSINVECSDIRDAKKLDEILVGVYGLKPWIFGMMARTLYTDKESGKVTELESPNWGGYYFWDPK